MTESEYVVTLARLAGAVESIIDRLAELEDVVGEIEERIYDVQDQLDFERGVS